MDKRSIHGGDDSHLCVEVSPVRGFSDPDGITVCSHEPEKAEGFAVYIRNPLAFHVHDFGPESCDETLRVNMADALAFAYRYADGLADHLGCAVVSSLPRPHDPLADLAPELRLRLVVQKGFDAEVMGGGVYGLFSRASGGGFVLVTGADGGLPAHDNWGVGLYLADDPDNAVSYFSHEPADPSPLTIFAAVEAALSALAEMEGR